MIIITNALINQAGSYYIITVFTLFGIEASYIPLHLDDISVITLNLSLASALCNNNIILVAGSRRAVVSQEAKNKQYAYTRLQAYATTTVSYLHGWQL